MLERMLFLGRYCAPQFDELRLLPGDRVSNPVRLHPEIIPNRAFKRNLLQRRRTHVAAWRGQFDLGRTVEQRLENKLGGTLVGPALRVNEPKIIRLAGFERKGCQRSSGVIRLNG